MKRYIEFIRKHRKPLLALFIILTLTAAAGLLRISINPDYNVFMPDTSEYKTTMEEMSRLFPGTENLIFLVNSGSETLTPETMHRFRGIQRFLEGIPGTLSVSGPAPDKIPAGGIGKFLNTGKITADQVPAVKEYFGKMGSLSPLVKQKGGWYGTFEVFPGKGFPESGMKTIEAYLKKTGLPFFASGEIYLQRKIIDYIRRILLFLPPAALILIFIVFRLQMGSIPATVFSILPAGIGALWTMGMIGWIGHSISIITVLAPIFTIVIGSADGLHFISHVQDERGRGAGSEGSLVSTLKMIGVPMIITTVTSIAGFLSLLVMNNSSIKQLALFASVGILLAGAATWYVLPLILTGNVPVGTGIGNGSHPAARGLRKLWGVPAVVIAAVLIAVSVFGIRRISTEFNLLSVYKKSTDVYKSFDKVMEVNKGAVPVFLYITLDGDPLAPENAGKLITLEKQLKADPAAAKVISGYDLYGMMHSVLFRTASPEFPQKAAEISLISRVFGSMKENPAENFINRKQHAVRMIIFPADMHNAALDSILRTVDRFRDAHPEISVRPTGVLFLMRELNDHMIANEGYSILLAFVLIFIMLIAAFRNILTALVSLVPIGCTVLFLFGFLGLSGFSLNIVTTTIFSITIGIGIDYAIHFTSVWRSFRIKGSTAKEAAEQAYAYTARPILANAIGIAVGLSALLLSPLRVHLIVSVMMWAAMTAGVFLSLTVLPSLLNIFKPVFKRRIEGKDIKEGDG